MITISPGNRKLGGTPNVSLPPGKACPNSTACIGTCYAMKSYKRWPSVRKAYDKNWDVLQENPGEYFAEIIAYLDRKQPRYFRWHTSGDIPDQVYLEHLKFVAAISEGTQFMCYTKNYQLDVSELPANLCLSQSIWPGLDAPDMELPMAFMQDGTETRVENAYECRGDCSECRVCWSLNEIKKNVVFLKH